MPLADHHPRDINTQAAAGLGGDEAPRFDFDSVFSDSYLYFYGQNLTDERSIAEAGAIWNLLGLRERDEVLDLGCGHGRISNRLAKRGASVTGLDASDIFLETAREQAAAIGADVTYLRGDMRALPWREQFDAAISWYTTFGYFDEHDNQQVLQEAAAALKPGGRLLIDQLNRAFLLKQGVPQTNVVQRGNDVMIDSIDYDGWTDRRNTDRLIVRDGSVSRMTLSIRLYSFAEFAQMLRKAGFRTVTAFGKDGEPFTLYGPRIVVIAQK